MYGHPGLESSTSECSCKASCSSTITSPRGQMSRPNPLLKYETFTAKTSSPRIYSNVCSNDLMERKRRKKCEDLTLIPFHSKSLQGGGPSASKQPNTLNVTLGGDDNLSLGSSWNSSRCSVAEEHPQVLSSQSHVNENDEILACISQTNREHSRRRKRSKSCDQLICRQDVQIQTNPSHFDNRKCSPKSNQRSTFDSFCQTTSLHGWKFLSSRQSQKPLKIGWMGVVLASLGVAAFFLTNSILDFMSSTVQTTQDTSRGSLKNVYFPSVTLCNINQGRHSLFRQVNLSFNETLLLAVLRQAYFGSAEDLTEEQLSMVRAVFSSEEVVRKGILTDIMFHNTPFRSEAMNASELTKGNWKESANLSYVSDAGWYFKTLAVQELGENFVLSASYRRVVKDTSLYTSLLPFFGTDYGLCTLIKPQISFDPKLQRTPFETLMKNFTHTIKPGIQLGKENGLSILLDTEVYDYGFSPQRGEGFKVAIHHHMDQPIMALSDVDISPGFVTQLSVTPTLTLTTEEAKRRFRPEERMCYFDDEFRFKYLPQELYRDYPRICAGKSLLCMNNILSNIGSHTHAEDTEGNRKPCFSPCIDQTNKMAVTLSVFPNLHTFTLGPEFCSLYKKLLASCKSTKRTTLDERYPSLCLTIFRNQTNLCLNKSTDMEEKSVTNVVLEEQQQVLSKDPQLVEKMYRYARENLALVNIYIKDPAVTQVKRDQKVPLIWFIANVGGILGLTMGCSLVTVFEILHHLSSFFVKTSAKSLYSFHKSVITRNVPPRSRLNRNDVPKSKSPKREFRINGHVGRNWYYAEDLGHPDLRTFSNECTICRSSREEFRTRNTSDSDKDLLYQVSQSGQKKVNGSVLEMNEIRRYNSLGDQIQV